jgi:hypothetical protein
MKFIACVVVVVIFFGIAALDTYYSYKEPERQRLNGRVSFIDWKSRNHLIPLILLKRKNGTEQKFHHSRITLTSKDLKVGDLLVKESNSKTCQINGEPIVCVE